MYLLVLLKTPCIAEPKKLEKITRIPQVSIHPYSAQFTLLKKVMLHA